MDFQFTNGQPELDLELNSEERVRKPIDVKRPSVTEANVCASKVMSVDELLDMNDSEFQLHDYDNSPGVLLGLLLGLQLLLEQGLDSLVILIMPTLRYRIVNSCTPILVCLPIIINGRRLQ